MCYTLDGSIGHEHQWAASGAGVWRPRALTLFIWRLGYDGRVFFIICVHTSSVAIIVGRRSVDGLFSMSMSMSSLSGIARRLSPGWWLFVSVNDKCVHVSIDIRLALLYGYVYAVDKWLFVTRIGNEMITQVSVFPLYTRIWWTKMSVIRVGAVHGVFVAHSELCSTIRLLAGIIERYAIKDIFQRLRYGRQYCQSICVTYTVTYESVLIELWDILHWHFMMQSRFILFAESVCYTIYRK